MKSILQISNNKHFKNGIWLYLLQFFNLVVPLLTLPYVTRVLGAEKYGVFSIALNILTYMQVIVEYGFGMSATRKVVLSEGENINSIFTAIICIRSFLVFLCIVFTGIYIIVGQTQNDSGICLLIMCVSLFGTCMQLNWLFQGMQEMKYISIINIISRTISVILTFLFIKHKNDLILYCFLYAISPFISSVLGIIIAKKKYQLRIVRIHLNDIIQEFKDGFYVFTTQLSSKVFGIIGVTFMGIFASDYEVGVFSAISKVSNVIILCWSPISQVLYPISSSKMKNGFDSGLEFVIKMCKVIMPLFVFLGILIIILNRFIVMVAFGHEYVGFSFYLIPLIVWVIVAIANNFLGIQILLGSGHDKEYGKCFQVGVISSIVFNFLLVYYCHGIGASVAPLLSEILLLTLLFKSVIKIKREKEI